MASRMCRFALTLVCGVALSTAGVRRIHPAPDFTAHNLHAALKYLAR